MRKDSRKDPIGLYKSLSGLIFLHENCRVIYLNAISAFCIMARKKYAAAFLAYIIRDYESVASMSLSLDLKSKVIHHIAEIATIIYIALLKIESVPPKSHATRSNWKIPTSPQLTPPIISRISAILSSNILSPPLSGEHFFCSWHYY